MRKFEEEEEEEEGEEDEEGVESTCRVDGQKGRDRGISTSEKERQIGIQGKSGEAR